MGSAEKRAKDSNMAAYLKAHGIYHGKRLSSPSHNNNPVNETGSAAYRRLMKKKNRTR